MSLPRRSPLLAPCLLLVASLVVACGGGSGASAPPGATAAAASADAAGGSESTGANLVDTGTGGTSAAAAAPDWNRLVVRDAQLTLQVGDVAQAVAWARGVATASGGLVFASSTSMRGDQQVATLTLRVPADRFDDVMTQLRSGDLVKEVEREDSSSQDVTAEYVDNDSQLAALRETQARLLALLGQASSLDDVLRLEGELRNVRGQIETIQGRQNYLKDATTYSTVTVALLPVGAAALTSADGAFDPARAVRRAWQYASGALEAALTVVITLTILAAAFAPLAGIAWLGWSVTRKRWSKARPT